MRDLIWVVGSGGMLGSAVLRHLRADDPEQVFTGGRISWGQPGALSDLETSLRRLVTEAGATWQIYWCAGAGVTSSGADSLRSEVALLESFFSLVSQLPPDDRARGSVFLASSAGAVYGGSVGAPFDEDSIPVPLGEYGTSKLLMEAALTRLSGETGMPVLIGRIANLYGPGQSLAKQQGIVSQLCKASLLGQPISLFVSLDTRRDYIFVDDCAALIAQAGARLRRVDRGTPPVIKILASGRSVTLASILGEFRRVIGRRPRVVTGVSPHAGLQGLDLRFLSRVWPDLDRGQKTPLAVGMSRTLADLSLQLNAGGAVSLGAHK